MAKRIMSLQFVPSHNNYLRDAALSQWCEPFATMPDLAGSFKKSINLQNIRDAMKLRIEVEFNKQFFETRHTNN